MIYLDRVLGSPRREHATELALLVALAVWLLAPLVYLVAVAGSEGLSFTGATGLFPGDQLQYFSWIRSAGEHLLAANGFDLAPEQHVFLHPMFTPSGLLWRAGLGAGASYLLWTPVAVAVLFFGCRRYCAALLPAGGRRAAALALALFAVSPVGALADWAGLSQAAEIVLVAGESSTAAPILGYLPIAITLGAMAFFLVGVDRLLDQPTRRASLLAATGACGALVSWLHPWQGETLLLACAGLVLWARPQRRHAVLAVPVAATLLPLLYYLVLSRTDSAWALAQAQTQDPRPGLLVIAVILAPLAAFAVAGVRRPSSEPRERLLVLWPVASLAVTLVVATNGASHGLEGITIPLAVLAVRGWQRLGAPRPLAVPALALATLPGLAYTADLTRAAATERRPGFFLRQGERDAFRALDDDARPGGVLSSPELGFSVPALAGRRVWVGHPSWSPRYHQRAREATDLFAGRLTPTRARSLVRRSGARFLLSPCRGADLRPVLTALVLRSRRYGCATLYEVRQGT